MSADEGAPASRTAPSLPSVAAVIGLGLIGGSIARDLASRGVRLLLEDRDAESLESALRALPEARAVSAEAELAEADLIIIATPVDAAGRALRRIADRLGPATMVTDVGSTKAEICRLAVDLGIGDRFVGSHPFTGDHRSGWSASRAGLFARAPIYLCPTEHSSDHSLERVRAFWSALGASMRVLDPAAHDMMMAWASHLPQIASSAVGLVLRSHRISLDSLGPGGRDVVRLAASSPAVWTAIALQNGPAIDEALQELQLQLGRFRTAIEQRDDALLNQLFRESRGWYGGPREESGGD